MNPAQFKGMLANLAQEERGNNPQAPRKVVGVYIGWPGLSANKEPLETMSFYSRKNTGDRVGNYGGVTEVLFPPGVAERLDQQVPAQGHDPELLRGCRAHFGAQVVYDSLMQVVTQRVAERKVTKYLEAPSPAMRAALAPNLSRAGGAAGRRAAAAVRRPGRPHSTRRSRGSATST